MDPVFLFLFLFIVLSLWAIFCTFRWLFAATDRDFYRDSWTETSERHGQLFHRLNVERAEKWDLAKDHLELDRDLRRIKIAIWGTAEIDRNVSDIVKLIAEWRTAIADRGLRIADLEEALIDANQVCHEAHRVANRMGRQINWAPHLAMIEESLERQHRVLHPDSAPQSAIRNPQSAIE